MTLVNPGLEKSSLDAPPEMAGMPFEPGPGDKILLEQGHIPTEFKAYAGRISAREVIHEVIDVWSNLSE